MYQKELHLINEKQSLDIEIHHIEDGFLIKYENGRIEGEKFEIRLDISFLISLLRDFEYKSKEVFLNEELNILKVGFDFYRSNSLYFDIDFENEINKVQYQARMYAFYKTNKHGVVGEIYAFNLTNNNI